MNKLNFRTFDLNLLRVFDEVMTQKSLTRAAANLALTQPAVSNAMRRLKDLLGDELIQRRGQSLVATPMALDLWPQVRKMLKEFEQALSPGKFDASQTEASFVMAMADATAAELMPAMVAILEEDAPNVTIRCVPLSTRDPRQLLMNETADIAVGYFPSALAELNSMLKFEPDIEFEFERLFDGHYVCVMRKDHPLAHQELDLDVFCQARHLMVSFSGRSFGAVDHALTTLGRKRRVVLIVNQFFTAGQVVAHSNLLTVLPKHFLSVTGTFDQLKIVELPFELPKVHIDMLWRKRLRQPQAHAWLRETISRASTRAFQQIKLKR